ncbi:MAG TPA: response regulator [Polyangiaceae bacterium]|nr:response regulator [Polyangiaceae bacterium]
MESKILIIDDDETVLEVTRAALESAGHRVVTHDRAGGCVALILQEKPDLVLMDVNMRHLSGDTIIGVLGKAQPDKGTIILLYSSLPAAILRAKADAAGAHGFVQKTGDAFALVREVNRWLKRNAVGSGRMRAASEFGAVSSTKLRVGPDLSSGQFRAASELADGASSETMLRTEPPSVLLIDRDMAVLSEYRRHLQAERFTVEFALSGSAALRSISSSRPPDVAVADAFMSDLSGIELYRRALALSPSWRQRMILTSERELPSVVPEFAEFRGQLLIKPISLEALRSAIYTCLSRPGSARPGRATAT